MVNTYKSDSVATIQERVAVIYNNPFQPFLAVDNDDEPVRSRQAKAFDPFAPFTSRTRTEIAARALEQAERDLAAARQRTPVEDDDDDRKKERLAKWKREGTLAERERIKTILTSPVALQQPRLADTFAFKSDIPAAEAIAAMEAQAPRADATQRTARETADLITLAAKRAHGLVPCEVTAGPKVFVKMTPEAIIAAARKAHGQD
jgi:hypothetical protein